MFLPVFDVTFILETIGFPTGLWRGVMGNLSEKEIRCQINSTVQIVVASSIIVRFLVQLLKLSSMERLISIGFCLFKL